MLHKKILFLLPSLLFFGCESDTKLNIDGSEITPAAQENGEAAVETPAQEPVQSGNSSEWDNIRWFTSRGPAGQKGAPQVMQLVARITDDGRFVNFSWDRLPWSGSGDQKIRAHFFVWNGSNWEGGMFEWIRPGGQTVKLTENIRNGYNGLRAPAPGARVAFAWTNERATERSNIAVTTWR